jgi:hypothetical protein
VRKVFRYQVPIDSTVHIIPLSGPVVAVGEGGNPERWLEFWAEHFDGVKAMPRAFQIYGTGQPVHDDAGYVGTTPRDPTGGIWHLYERGVN